MSRAAYFLLIALGAIVGTGSYVLIRPAMYLLVGLAAVVYCVLAANKKIKVNVQSSLILLFYLAFLLLNYLRDFGNETVIGLYLNFFLGICAYLLVVKNLSLVPETDSLRYIPLISLIVIALGVVAQLNGLISYRGDGEIASADEGLLLRPGGFLNPNRTATLSLIWLFCAIEIKKNGFFWLKAASIAVCLFIVFLTQSRAAMVFLFAYFAYKSLGGGLKSIKYVGLAIIGIWILFLLTSESGALDDILGSIAQRLQGDASSTERYYLLRTALSLFTESPLTGHGMRAMFAIAGLGTHNELVEWLVNFGVVGFFVMLLIFFRFYFISSFKYLCMCVLPTLLFSHNFFETTAFQVALAFAFVISKRSAETSSAKKAVWLDPHATTMSSPPFGLRRKAALRARSTLGA